MADWTNPEGPLFRPVAKDRKTLLRKYLNRSAIWEIVRRNALKASLDTLQGEARLPASPCPHHYLTEDCIHPCFPSPLTTRRGKVMVAVRPGAEPRTPTTEENDREWPWPKAGHDTTWRLV